MIISSKKYACETCIKGHRSSSCKHFDRPLFEIKKKGRPVTQCEHCRELRKTKQVHVKCICEGRSESPPAPKGTKPGFESAAFPNGLPLHAMETSVASEGVPSDSETGPGNFFACQCKDTGVCHCCVPRKAKSRKLPPAPHKTDLSVFGDPSRIQSNTAQILARIAELRPVLPRPSDPAAIPSYDLGTSSHNHHSAYHGNATTYSPYGQAYGVAHQYPFHPQQYNTPAPRPNTNPAICRCGDNCRCPGCIYHNNAVVPAETAFSSCNNPDTCDTCLDCTILSLQNIMIPSDTALSIPPSSSSSDAVDDWLQNISGQSASTGAYTDYATPGSSMWSGGLVGSDMGSAYVPSRMDLDFSSPDPRHARSGSLGQAPDLSNYHRSTVPIPYQRGPDYTRSRSASTSSQSSRPEDRYMSSPSTQVPYRPSGRLVSNEPRSTPPPLNGGGRRGGDGSARVSPGSYGSSNPDGNFLSISPQDCHPSMRGYHTR